MLHQPRCGGNVAPNGSRRVLRRYVLFAIALTDYFTGDVAYVTGTVVNRSSKRVKALKLSLVQNCSFHVQTRSLHRNVEQLSIKLDKSLEPGQSVPLRVELPLSGENICPSINNGVLVTVNYSIDITAEFGTWSDDISAGVPIVIGTFKSNGGSLNDAATVANQAAAPSGTSPSKPLSTVQNNPYVLPGILDASNPSSNQASLYPSLFPK
jgi:hypothetical protein